MHLSNRITDSLFIRFAPGLHHISSDERQRIIVQLDKPKLPRGFQFPHPSEVPPPLFSVITRTVQLLHSPEAFWCPVSHCFV